MNTLEPELQAMTVCFDALKDLDNSSQLRVIKWLKGKLNLGSLGQSDEEKIVATLAGDSFNNYPAVADFFSACNPQTEPDKVLAVATYLQTKENLSELTGLQIQKELKNLGHGVSNITVFIESLCSKKPKLMIQTRKDGKTRQAKKKYKVTIEGIKFVKAAIASNS